MALYYNSNFTYRDIPYENCYDEVAQQWTDPTDWYVQDPIPYALTNPQYKELGRPFDYSITYTTACLANMIYSRNEYV